MAPVISYDIDVIGVGRIHVSTPPAELQCAKHFSLEVRDFILSLSLVFHCGTSKVVPYELIHISSSLSMFRRIKQKLKQRHRERPAVPGVEEPQIEHQSEQPGFQYQPFIDARNEIRLLKITRVVDSSGDSADVALEVEMFHMPLQDSGSYIALSYAWGNPKPVRRIICYGQALYVPENTFRVLYTISFCAKHSRTALYEQHETLTLWIDAICINQSNVLEKNCQVPIMGNIYRNAKGAIGYVGAPSEGTNPNHAIHSMAWWANCPIIRPPEGLTKTRTTLDFRHGSPRPRKLGLANHRLHSPRI